MNKNLYLKELKRNRKNLIIWSSIVIGFTLMVLSIFPFMKEMGEDMGALLDSMPVELQKAMGMDAETWKNIMGFYSTYYGIYIVVLVSIYTTSTGTGIISKEEKDRTAEFLLTKPLSRQTIVKTKLAALFTLAVIIYVIQTLVAIVGVIAFGEGSIDWGAFYTLHFGGFILVLFFTAIGVLLSMYLKPKKNFMGIVVGLTFGMYFLEAISKATEATNWIGYFSPFHYLDFNVSGGNYEVNYISGIVMLALGALALLWSNKVYLKKDIAG